VEFLAKLIEFFTTGLSSQQELKLSDLSDNRVLIDPGLEHFVTGQAVSIHLLDPLP
jgi:hypothetical protein